MPCSWLLLEQPVLVQRFDEKVTRISVAGLRCGRWTPVQPSVLGSTFARAGSDEEEDVTNETRSQG